jgi:hypothetical protein
MTYTTSAIRHNVLTSDPPLLHLGISNSVQGSNVLLLYIGMSPDSLSADSWTALTLPASDSSAHDPIVHEKHNASRRNGTWATKQRQLAPFSAFVIDTASAPKSPTFNMSVLKRPSRLRSIKGRLV